MRKFLLVALCVWVSVTLTNAQTYSRVKQHVREYDGVIKQVEGLLPYLPTNPVAYASDLAFAMSNASIAEIVADLTNGIPATNTSASSLVFEAGDNVLLDHSASAGRSVVRVSASSAIAGPPGAPGVGGLVYAGTYDAGATYTNPATLVSFGRATYYTTNKWTGGGVESPTNASVWSTFVPGGVDGADGADGADGVGFNFLGPWSTNITTIGTNDCVSDGGQLFVPLVGLNVPEGIPQPAPNGVVNTNDYYVLVAKGANGASGSVSSNLFFCGDWVSGVAYTEMSVVVYSGQAYYATEAIAGPSYPIPGSAPWATFAAKGAKGEKGEQGVDGVGNLQFKGFFDLETLYPSNSVVAYPDSKPDWYRAKGLISGQYPTATSYWEKVLMSGLDASVFGVGYSVTYNPSTYYPSNHWLRHNGAVYASRQPVTGFNNQPPNATYWTLVVRDGTTLSTGLVWRGEWAAGTYVSNDLVTRNGSSYFVNTSNTVQSPPNTDWTLFASKGDRGVPGPAGTASVFNVFYQTNLTVLTQNVWNVTNNSYYVETNVYDTFLSHTSILNEVTYTNIYTNLGTTSDDAYRGDWGAYVSNRADDAYAMASAASSVAGATNLVIGAEETSYDPETRTIYSPAGTGGGGIEGSYAFSYFTNEHPATVSSTTSAITASPHVSKMIMWAETTNNPFSKTVNVELFGGASSNEEVRLSKIISRAFERTVFTTNTLAGAGTNEIAVVNINNIVDGSLVYVSSADGATSEFARVRTAVDAGSWTSPFYDGAQEAINSLCVYDGKLYAGQGSGPGDGDVYVFDGTTWSLSYDGAQEAINSLCVYDGKLYAGQGSGTGDGDVYVFDGTTWSLSYDGAQEAINSLCVYDGKLYAGQGNGPGDGDVYVFDGTTWSLSYDGSQKAIHSLCVYDGKLYAGQGSGTGDGDVYVFDGTTWSLSYDGAQEAIYSLCVYDGKLYAGQGSGLWDGDVYVFDGTTWSLSYDGAREAINSLCVYDGKLYAGQGWSGTGYGDVYVFDGTTWSLSYDGSQEAIYSLCVYDGKLYAGQGSGTGDGDVHRFVSDGLTTLEWPLRNSYGDGDWMSLCAEVDGWVGPTNLEITTRYVTGTGTAFNLKTMLMEVE